MRISSVMNTDRYLESPPEGRDRCLRMSLSTPSRLVRCKALDIYGNMQLFDARADKRAISVKVRDSTSHLRERFRGIFCMR
jgi:hypothetical protein